MLVFVPFIAYVIHQLSNVSSLTPPPPDFGSGRMFDQIANRYDFINRVLAIRMDVGWRKRMTRIVRQKLEEKSEATSPWLVLDVATGTADVALQLAQDLPSDTIIWGVDPSPNMLAIGRQKITKAQQSSQITLVQGDVRELSSKASSLFRHNDNNNNHHHDDDDGAEMILFDAITMAFGIRNVPERARALCELHSILKPGGTIAILEFSEPTDGHGLMGKAARLFIRYIVPVVGAVLSGAPKEYIHLQKSIKDFPSPAEFHTLMQTLECGDSDDAVVRFEMDDIIHMNFGSVQLYVGTAVKEQQKSPIRQFIQKEIDNHDVVIFSKSYCPYCKAATNLFSSNIMEANPDKLKIHQLDQLPNGQDIQDTLLDMTGQRTVPNIFIKGQHFGGNDAAQKAFQEGTLQAMLGY
jgi:demethylmenaquinone methyltransferase / 2-methoxy-6-polyprenyl-1,4-benzoquinol methylase